MCVCICVRDNRAEAKDADIKWTDSMQDQSEPQDTALGRFIIRHNSFKDDCPPPLPCQSAFTLVMLFHTSVYFLIIHVTFLMCYSLEKDA